MKLRCSTCRKTFPWDPVNGWPDHCPIPNCEAAIGGNRPDNEICMPSIRTMRSKVVDDIYRQTEKGSELRAQIAADHLGVPVSEMSGLKITDMNDRCDCEVAAKEDPAAMARLGIKNREDMFKSNGAEFSAGISTGDVTLNNQTIARGVAPRAGMTAQAGIQRAFGK